VASAVVGARADGGSKGTVGTAKPSLARAFAKATDAMARAVVETRPADLIARVTTIAVVAVTFPSTGRVFVIQRGALSVASAILVTCWAAVHFLITRITCPECFVAHALASNANSMTRAIVST